MGSDSININITTILKGNMIMYIVKRKDKLFVHYGLYITNDMIFHYASLTNNMFAHNQSVRVSSLNEFSMNRKISLYEIDNKISFYDIVSRAYMFSQNGRKYSIFNNNCISFILAILNNKRYINFMEMFTWIIKLHSSNQKT